MLRRLHRAARLHFLQRGIRVHDVVVPHIKVNERVVEEGRARKTPRLKLANKLNPLVVILAETTHQDQSRVRRRIRHKPCLQHILVDLERILETPHVSRRHDHRFVRVLVRKTLLARTPSHVVEHLQRSHVILRFPAGADERRQNVLIGFDVALLHVLEEGLRLFQRSHFRAARHQRRVRVLAQNVSARPQRIEEGHDDPQLLRVVQAHRLRNPRE